MRTNASWPAQIQCNPSPPEPSFGQSGPDRTRGFSPFDSSSKGQKAFQKVWFVYWDINGCGFSIDPTKMKENHSSSFQPPLHTRGPFSNALAEPAWAQWYKWCKQQMLQESELQAHRKSLDQRGTDKCFPCVYFHNCAHDLPLIG